MNTLAIVLTLLELVFLILGVSLPLAIIDEFWFFSSEFSIISLTSNLLLNGEYPLAFVIIVFGFIFPILKLLNRIMEIKILENFPLHKFAMVDIFLLSFLIFGGKLSYFYEVTLQIGFYFLLLSIILSYLYLMIFRKTLITS